MGKIISAAGEVTFVTSGVRSRGSNLIIVGKMGIWDAEVYLSSGEMLRVFFNPRTLFALIRIPLFLIANLFRRKKTEHPAGSDQ
ncbi:MAG: hypothetical protein HYX87_06030 [Chloroflexi bacterium]|nr:hypothetical protein [Chloroflexota bacterium]